MNLLLDFLKGRWLGHPLHPVIVSLPYGLWPAALVFDVLSRVSADGAVFVRLAFWSIAVGLAAVLAAVPTGLADWSEVKPDRPAWKIGLYHLILNVVATAVWAVNLYLRTGEAFDAAEVPTVPLALSAVGTALVLTSGYLGGRMVYEYGVGVARFNKGELRRTALAGGARVPPEKG